MAAAEMTFLHGQLTERKQRLESVMEATPGDAHLQAMYGRLQMKLEPFAVRWRPTQ
jgi:hypothetical protein